MRIGSLFSGIGGLELGLEWAGVGHTVWQVESDDYCRRVLARHWPNATRYDDVRTAGAHNLEPVDVICGGFPCQDISVAGRGAGLGGARSGLWSEFARIIEDLRPEWVVVENVAALESKAHRKGLHAVLGHLRSLGYSGERAILSAADVGAPHRRDRLFILAHSKRTRRARPVADNGIPRSPRSAHAIARDGIATPWLSLDEGSGSIREGDGIRVTMERRRLSALGNAVVPQCAEVVGKRLLQIAALPLSSTGGGGE